MGVHPQRRQRPQLRSITIEDIVQTDVVTAQPDTPIATVVAKMAEEDVGAVVVVEDDEPRGVITDRKIALALEEDPNVTEREASELASEEIITVTTDSTVFDVLETISDENVRRVPVVDEDGTLSGIVTLDDILVLLASELNRAGDVIQAQSPRL